VTGRTAIKVHIHNAESELERLFSATLDGARVKSARTIRGGFAQVLEIAGDGVTIVAGLLAIKAILWPPKPTPPSPMAIIIENWDGDSLELADATEENLRKLVEPPPDEKN
jgi:hypothetical protein